MTPDELRALGSRLGRGWQTKLARLVPCSARTIRYLLKGDRPIRPIMAARIRDVVKQSTRTTGSCA